MKFFFCLVKIVLDFINKPIVVHMIIGNTRAVVCYILFFFFFFEKPIFNLKAYGTIDRKLAKSLSF